jgi:prefoldin alpha subunit
MKDENAQRELTQKFMMFEQQINLIQNQLDSVDRAIIDLRDMDMGLEELIGKEGNEILAQIGKGIYAKANLASEDLIVDIGGKNFVKKSIPETKKILQEQIEKLNKIKKELNSELDKINESITKVFMESRN